jgi:hypothetical protein
MTIFRKNASSAKRKKVEFAVIVNAINFLFVVLVALCFSRSSLVMRDSFSLDLRDAGSKTDDGEIGFRFYPSYSGKPMASFAASYTHPKNTYSSMVISSTNNNPNLFSLSSESLGVSFNNLKMVTGCVFTNNKKMESLDLELVKNLGPSVEFSRLSPIDGFVYIPDVFANCIIEANSNDAFNSYDDILGSSFLVSVGSDFGSFLYRVSNIFYTGNFKYCADDESYQGLDFGYGSILYNHFGPFIVTVNNNSIWDKTENSVFSVCSPKQFIINDLLALYSEENISDFQYDLLCSGKLSVESNVNFLDFYNPSAKITNGVNGFLFVFLIIFIAAFIFFIVRLFQHRDFSFVNSFSLCAGILFYELVFQILLGAKLLSASTASLIFNFYGNCIFLFLLFVYFVPCFLRRYQNERLS